LPCNVEYLVACFIAMVSAGKGLCGKAWILNARALLIF